MDETSSQSESEPFSADSSGNFEPTDSNDSSDSERPNRNTRRAENGVDGAILATVTHKRKKIQNPEQWKRNIRKKKLVKGEEHVNTAGKLVPQRSTGPACKCRKKCFDKVNMDNRRAIITSFNDLAGKNAQDGYLAGIITSIVPSRARERSGERRKKSVTHKYKIRVGPDCFDVCKTAFCSLHGISLKRAELIASHIAKPLAITPPHDKRGKHKNKPNAIPAEITEQIHTHIHEFPRRKSHYGRSKNLGIYYFSSELNVKKIYELYLEKFEPNMHEVMKQNREKTSDFKPKVTYDFFFRYFKTNFSNCRFGRPRTDTCQKCDLLENKKKSSISADDLKAIEVDQKLHQTRARTFFTNLEGKTALAKNDATMDTLCFDFQQNAPLPKVPSGDAFYLRQLWAFNFCIHSAKSQLSHYYVYDELTAKKTPNETCSLLMHYFDNILDKNVDTLYLFSDNCAAQNKNHTVVQFLHSLVQNGRFKQIIHRFPEPGHSFLPCDRSFRRTEKYMRRVERIYTLQEHINHLKKSSKTCVTIEVTQEMILNYVAFFGMYFKKAVVDKNKQKFAISKQKIFQYDAETPEIQCSQSTGFPIYSNFDIRQKNTCFPISLPTLENKAYNGQFTLKKVKYDNVMTLATKYVSEDCMPYYTNLINAASTSQNANHQETDYTDDDSGSED